MQDRDAAEVSYGQVFMTALGQRKIQDLEPLARARIFDRLQFKKDSNSDQAIDTREFAEKLTAKFENIMNGKSIIQLNLNNIKKMNEILFSIVDERLSVEPFKSAFKNITEGNETEETRELRNTCMRDVGVSLSLKLSMFLRDQLNTMDLDPQQQANINFLPHFLTELASSYKLDPKVTYDNMRKTFENQIKRSAYGSLGITISNDSVINKATVNIKTIKYGFSDLLPKTLATNPYFKVLGKESKALNSILADIMARTLQAVSQDAALYKELQKFIKTLPRKLRNAIKSREEALNKLEESGEKEVKHSDKPQVESGEKEVKFSAETAEKQSSLQRTQSFKPTSPRKPVQRTGSLRTMSLFGRQRENNASPPLKQRNNSPDLSTPPIKRKPGGGKG